MRPSLPVAWIIISPDPPKKVTENEKGTTATNQRQTEETNRVLLEFYTATTSNGTHLAELVSKLG